MAFTYDASQATFTDLNYLRARLGDTDSAYPLFTDAEMNAIITKCTTGGVLNFDHAVGILQETLSADPIRVIQSRKATSGAVSLIDELELYATRSEVYTD